MHTRFIDASRPILRDDQRMRIDFELKPPSPSTHLQPTLEWENAFLCQFVKIRTAFALFRQHYYTYDKFESINLPTQFPSLSQITDSINPNSSQDPIYTILSSIDPTILSLTSLPAPPRENLPMGVNEDLSEGDEPLESNNEGEQTDEEQSDIDSPLPTSNQPSDQDHSTTNKLNTAKLPPILFNSPTTSSLLKMSQKSINGNVICLVEYSAHHDITLSIQHIFRVKIVQKHPHHQSFKIQKKTENSQKVEQIEQLGLTPLRRKNRTHNWAVSSSNFEVMFKEDVKFEGICDGSEFHLQEDKRCCLTFCHQDRPSITLLPSPNQSINCSETVQNVMPVNARDSRVVSFSLGRLRAQLVLSIVLLALALITFIVGIFVLMWPLFAVTTISTLCVVFFFKILLRYSMNSIPRAPLFSFIIFFFSAILSFVSSISQTKNRTLFYVTGIISFCLTVISFIFLFIHTGQLIKVSSLHRTKKTQLDNAEERDSLSRCENVSQMPIAVNQEPAPRNITPRNPSPALSPDVEIFRPELIVTEQLPMSIPPEGNIAEGEEDESDHEPPLKLAQSVFVNPQPIIPFTHADRPTIYSTRESSSQGQAEGSIASYPHNLQQSTSVQFDQSPPEPHMTKTQSVLLTTVFKGEQKVFLRPEPTSISTSADDERYDPYPLLVNIEDVKEHYKEQIAHEFADILPPDPIIPQLANSSHLGERRHSEHNLHEFQGQALIVKPSQKMQRVGSANFLSHSIQDQLLELPDSSMTFSYNAYSETTRENTVMAEWLKALKGEGHSNSTHSDDIAVNAVSPSTNIGIHQEVRPFETTHPQTIGEPATSSHQDDQDSSRHSPIPRPQLTRNMSAFQMFNRQESKNSNTEAGSPSFAQSSQSFARIPSLLPKTASFVAHALLNHPQQANLVAVPSKTELVLERTADGFQPVFKTVPVFPEEIPQFLLEESDSESDELDNDSIDDWLNDGSDHESDPPPVAIPRPSLIPRPNSHDRLRKGPTEQGTPTSHYISSPQPSKLSQSSSHCTEYTHAMASVIGTYPTLFPKLMDMAFDGYPTALLIFLAISQTDSCITHMLSNGMLSFLIDLISKGTHPYIPITSLQILSSMGHTSKAIATPELLDCALSCVKMEIPCCILNVQTIKHEWKFPSSNTNTPKTDIPIPTAQICKLGLELIAICLIANITGESDYFFKIHRALKRTQDEVKLPIPIRRHAQTLLQKLSPQGLKSSGARQGFNFG
ncbi:hypothetical protein BLNAU_4401 [Blattamonas nauphoetae]|uniref:Uncharacterized protein n=1 Tax=Blattamonas nauphoetae TaxID=2049346 RepID=A0ABQ9Y9Y2_9EUKA|nr:hypothetical protein BLNAU_4401 [Blattamonas nauphoetae]